MTEYILLIVLKEGIEFLLVLIFIPQYPVGIGIALLESLADGPIGLVFLEEEYSEDIEKFNHRVLSGK